MSKQVKITSISLLFLIVALINIYGNYTNNTLIDFITKPLLTVLLASLYLVAVPKPKFLYISALFFAFWGDVLLLFPDQFFVFGLASFLLCHVLLISVLTKFLPKVSVQQIIFNSIPFLLILAGLLYLIFPNLGEMKIPVIVYGVVISVFGVLSLILYNHQKNTENLWLFLGAFIFILSDSILALNKFYEPSELLSNLIMLTYITAQFLICKALIVKHSS